MLSNLMFNWVADGRLVCCRISISGWGLFCFVFQRRRWHGSCSCSPMDGFGWISHINKSMYKKIKFIYPIRPDANKIERKLLNIGRRNVSLHLVDIQSIDQNPWRPFVAPINACPLQREAMMTPTGPSIHWCCPSTIYTVYLCDAFRPPSPVVLWWYTWPNHNNLQCLTVDSRSSWGSARILTCCQT